MSTNIACCGLDCFECPAYKATIANDEDLRKKTAAEWSQAYQGNFKPEDINCLGCKSDLLFSHCKTCNIRACNVDQSHDNCAKCDSFFGCDKLEGFLKNVPDAKKNLEEIKNKLSHKSA